MYIRTKVIDLAEESNTCNLNIYSFVDHMELLYGQDIASMEKKGLRRFPVTDRMVMLIEPRGHGLGMATLRCLTLADSESDIQYICIMM